MLYDKRWDLPPVPAFDKRADPFDLRTLTAWLSTQPKTKTFRPSEASSCLLTQYFRHMFDDPSAMAGVRGRGHRTQTIRYFFGLRKRSVWAEFKYPREFDEIAWMTSHGYARDTFGAALTRARQALADQDSRASGGSL